MLVLYLHGCVCQLRRCLDTLGKFSQFPILSNEQVSLAYRSKTSWPSSLVSLEKKLSTVVFTKEDSSKYWILCAKLTISVKSKYEDFSNCQVQKRVINYAFSCLFLPIYHGTKLNISHTEEDSQLCVYSLYTCDYVPLYGQKKYLVFLDNFSRKSQPVFTHVHVEYLTIKVSMKGQLA